MELLQPLLVVYSGVMLVNVMLMALLWYFFKETLYKYGILLWVCALLNFVMQGMVAQHELGSVLAFSTYYLCALLLVRVLESTSELKVPYNYYHGLFCVAICCSVIISYMGMSFTAIAIPCAIAVAVPMLYSGWRVLKDNAAPQLSRLFAFILLLNGLHFLDYPFLRPIPEMALFGFSLAFVLVIILSLYLPVFISKITSDRYAKQLSDEIERRKEVEQHLITARKQAEVADRVKGEFLSVMSHELRTPLNGILGMADVLVESDLQEEDRETAQIIGKCGEELLHMIERILAFSELEAGPRGIVAQDHFSPYQCVEEAINNVSFKARAKNIDVVSLFGDDVPQFIFGDALKLTELLTGLLDNAVKFSDKGKVTVHVSKSEIDKPCVVFKVIDQGIGIEPEKISAIFEVFHQNDVSLTRKYGGVGIGLAICKKLAELLDGNISVESEVGKGTTFSFAYTYH